LEIAAHLSQKLSPDFLLSILQSGEFITEVQPAMASLPFVSHELAGDILPPSQLPNSALEFRTPHHPILGHFCPKVKGGSLFLA
jgi:hypothetical protein